MIIKVFSDLSAEYGMDIGRIFKTWDESGNYVKLFRDLNFDGILGVMLIYAILMFPVVMAVLRSIDSTEKFWRIIPLVTLLGFLVVANCYIYWGRDDQVVNMVTITRSDKEDTISIASVYTPVLFESKVKLPSEYYHADTISPEDYDRRKGSKVSVIEKSDGSVVLSSNSNDSIDKGNFLIYGKKTIEGNISVEDHNLGSTITSEVINSEEYYDITTYVTNNTNMDYSLVMYNKKDLVVYAKGPKAGQSVNLPGNLNLGEEDSLEIYSQSKMMYEPSVLIARVYKNEYLYEKTSNGEFVNECFEKNDKKRLMRDIVDGLGIADKSCIVLLSSSKGSMRSWYKLNKFDVMVVLLE